jgi:hypothetical protein
VKRRFRVPTLGRIRVELPEGYVPPEPTHPQYGYLTPEEPLPDVAAAAGGRGASSSWTTADGQRLRRDARAQRWVTEPAEPPS